MFSRNYQKFFWALTVLLSLMTVSSVYAQRKIPDRAYQTLQQGNVYVARSLQNQISSSTLQNAASSTVKIAILNAVPNGPWMSRSNPRDQYAAALHHALHLGNNGLVLVVPPGAADAGVSVISNGLGSAEDARLARQYRPQIRNNIAAGTAALAQAVAAGLSGNSLANTGNAVAGTANNNSGHHGGAILGFIFLLVVIIVVLFVWSASRKKKQELMVERGPIEGLRENVLKGIEYIDHYADVLPRNNPDSETVRAARQAASDKYEQASNLLGHAANEASLNRAQGLLDRAQADIQQARGALDRALGGTSHIPGDDAFRPPPMPQNQQQVNAIPASQRAVSFFSGQPAPLGSLVPVTLSIGGQPRQVYVTPAEAAQIQQGQTPQVRAFNVGGQSVPWYAYNQYDPYRDYWQYQNNGWGGFAGGALAGFVGAELLGDLMNPGYGGGYSPYAFSPDFAYNQGYDNAMNNMDMSNQFGDYSSNAGGNFDGGLMGGDQGGGADFGSDPSNQGGQGFDDYANTGDQGGGADFGGGSDFGDSGGGADFGGDDGGGAGF